MAIKVYGADWCPMTTTALAHLRELDVEFEYIDIDQDRKAAGWVREQNKGREKKPTIDINGAVLTEPSNSQLEDMLREHNLIP